MNLSKRQKEICDMVYEGKSLTQIGLELGISPKTVSSHKEKAFKKLGVSNDIEFVKKIALALAPA